MIEPPRARGAVTPESRMDPPPVVEGLDAEEDVYPRLGPRAAGPVMRLLSPESGAEAP